MTPNQRKSSPALYELVGNGRPARTETNHVRPREVTPERAPDTLPSPPSTPQLEGQIAPGGSVRVPAGVIFLIVAIVFAALFAGYLIGYQQKSNELVDEASKQQVDNLQLPRDPLNTPQNAVTGTETRQRSVTPRPENRAPVVDPTPDDSTVVADGGGAQNADSVRLPGDPLTVIVENGIEDPRERGLNYLAFTSESRERIEPFLAYLNANGVDAAAYPVNNGVYRIYALRGFRGGSYLEPSGVSFENEIRALTETFVDGQGRTLRFSRLWERH